MTTRDVYRALWAHKLFIGVATLLLVGAVWYLTSRQTPIYQTGTLVRVEYRITGAGQGYAAVTTSQKLAQSYAAVVGTSKIQRRIYDQLKGQVPLGHIAGQVSAAAVTDLDLVRINVRGPSPADAQRVAAAAPAALEDY